MQPFKLVDSLSLHVESYHRNPLFKWNMIKKQNIAPLGRANLEVQSLQRRPAATWVAG